MIEILRYVSEVYHSADGLSQPRGIGRRPLWFKASRVDISPPPNLDSRFRSDCLSVYSAGLRRLASLLASVDASNSHPVFVAAVLVCITTLAQGPRAGKYLLFSDIAVAEWFPLVQGLKSVLTTFSISAIFSGPLRLFSCHTARASRTTADILHLPRLQWIGPFNQLKDFVAKSSGIEMGSNVSKQS